MKPTPMRRVVPVVGLAAVFVLVVVACSGSATPPIQAPWVKPSIADVSHAARLSFSTRVTCREGDDGLHDINESTFICHEHPRDCTAPGDSVGEFGCYAIGCDVHMAVALQSGKSIDFYNCDRYNGDCSSVTGGCPSPTYSCVTGRGHHLAVDPSRGTDDVRTSCPLDSEVHPEDH